MRTIIAGSRTITSLVTVERAMQDCPWPVTEVVSGRAPGVDRLGERWAELHDIPITFFPAAWRRADGTTNRAAGFERNGTMARRAQALVAVWDGKSKGTWHMIETMRKQGKPVYVVEVTA